MTDSQNLTDGISNQEILNDVESHSEIIHALSADSERETDTDGDDEHDFDDGIKSARFKNYKRNCVKKYHGRFVILT